VAVFEFASFWGVRLQKLAKIDFQDFLEEAASMFPTDARLLKLLNRAREILVRAARQGAGIKLHQFYHRVGKFALIKHQRYASPSNSSAPKALRTLRTYLGRVIRDIATSFKAISTCSMRSRSTACSAVNGVKPTI